jgi:CheY-like chemotaxis protein
VAVVIQETSRLLRRVIGEDVTLDVQTAPDLPPIFADQGMVEQVLLNLAVNARDAMPKGGRLTIKTSVIERDAAYRQAVPQALAGRHVCIAVADTGHGIPPDVLPRIFEPFFTTKEVGKGTGLGLATVYGIVQQHFGWIEVDSVVDHGTEFRVCLPSVARPAEAAAGPAAGEDRARGAGTILVVEDDALVRASSCLILQRNGYRILEAVSPQAALELWAAHRAEIDLVFTDVVMPGGLTGRELADKLRADRADLRVLFTSGYSADFLERDFVRTAMNSFLQKPFGADELIRSVRECLRTG